MSFCKSNVPPNTPIIILVSKTLYEPGADPGFQVRGGALKKNASSGGRREIFVGISCEKSRFYAKKSYFFQIAEVGAKILGFFVWKITILRQKIIFFSNFRGGAPPGSAPAICHLNWRCSGYNIFSVYILYYHPLNTGARCVRKPPQKNYIKLQGGELTYFHFF